MRAATGSRQGTDRRGVAVAALIAVIAAGAPVLAGEPAGVLVVGDHSSEVGAAVARELVRRGARLVPAAQIAAPESSAEQVQAAALAGQVEASIRRAEELFYQVQLKAAASLVEEELGRSALALAFAGRFDLLRALHLWQGVCATKLGQATAARSAFHASAALDDRAPDPTRFPPAIGVAYSAAARELAARPKGRLTLVVTPGSAELRVDGKPASGKVLSLVQGAHWVELRALGFAPAVRRVVIAGKDQRLELRLGVASQAQLQQELHRQQQRGSLDQTRPEVAAAIGRLQGAGDALVVKERAASGPVEISFQRIRCSDAVLLERVVERAPIADRALAVQRAMLRLWPVAARAAPPEPRPPVYKRWWFWALVGGGVAVAGGATALGVVLSRQSPEIVHVGKVTP